MFDYCRHRFTTLLAIGCLIHGAVLIRCAEAQVEQFGAEADEPSESDPLLRLFGDSRIFDELDLNKSQRESVQKAVDAYAQALEDLQQTYDERLKSITSIGESRRPKSCRSKPNRISWHI